MGISLTIAACLVACGSESAHAVLEPGDATNVSDATEGTSGPPPLPSDEASPPPALDGGGGPDGADGGTVDGVDGIDGLGDLDPFSAAHCVGPELTFAEAAALFGPGETMATFGAFTTFQRSRRCTDATGCTAWSEPARHEGFMYGYGQTLLHLTSPTTIELELVSWAPSPTRDVVCTSPVGAPITCSTPTDAWSAPATLTPGVLRRSCFALRHTSTIPDGLAATWEFERVIVGRHRRAGALTSPALAAKAHTITSPCLFCGPGGCGVPSVVASQTQLEGDAVRVTSMPGDDDPFDVLVPIDDEGRGSVVTNGTGVQVFALGPTLGVSIGRSGHTCRAVLVLP